jgi:hypothetical protein
MHVPVSDGSETRDSMSEHTRAHTNSGQQLREAESVSNNSHEKVSNTYTLLVMITGRRISDEQKSYKITEHIQANHGNRMQSSQ